MDDAEVYHRAEGCISGMKNPKRTRVATGIYADQCGYLATVSGGRLRRDQRFPPDTAIPFMQRWRAHTKADLLDRAAGEVVARTLPSENWKRLKPSADGWCYVYFVRAGERIKIGRAVDVAQRFRGLQTAHPEELSLVLSIAAHAALEAAIHKRFAHLRDRGEWFRLEPDLVTFIAAVQHGANPVALLFDGCAPRARWPTTAADGTP